VRASTLRASIGLASVLASVLAAAFVLSACPKKSEPPAPAPPARSAEAPAAKLSGSLRVVCWDGYVTAAVAQDFEKEFGVKVHVDYVNNNEEVMDRLAKGEVWDVWTPSDYAVKAATEKGLLAPLDKAKLPNLANVGRRFQNAVYDPEFTYAVPFYWGTTGLAYDKRKVQGTPDSWGYVFDPALRAKVKGPISLLNDVRESMAIALLYLGFDPNSTDPAQLDKAKGLLARAKAAGVRFDSEGYDDDIEASKIAMAHGWSGDLSRSMAKNPRIEYVLPKEGFALWVDNFAIPAKGQNREAALALINYILRPEVAAKLTNDGRNPTTVPEARPAVLPEILNSPSYLLPEDRTFHVFRYLGVEGTARMDKAWAEVTGGK